MKNKKIKLIFFHPYSYIGGADNSLKRLIDNLDKNKFSITFVSLNNSFLKKTLGKKIQFITLKADRAIFSIFQLKKLVLKNYENNAFKKVIVISNQNYANLVCLFATYNLKNIKKVLIERNHLDELSIYFNVKEFFKKNFLKLLIKLLYPKADKIIGISEKLSNDLKKFINKNVTTIYNPAFDKSIYRLAKKKVHLTNKSDFIINVSRFTKRKDHRTTLLAFNEVAKISKKLKLVLIGYGSEMKNILNLSKLLNIKNKVIIIEKCSNPYPYIKKAKLLIHTSVYEGFCNVLVEGIMLNTPVISTNCNAGPSEILLNGRGGDLINIGDFKSLAKNIKKFLKNSKKLKDKTKVSKKNLERFEIKTNVKKYSYIFEKI